MAGDRLVLRLSTGLRLAGAVFWASAVIGAGSYLLGGYLDQQTRTRFDDQLVVQHAEAVVAIADSGGDPAVIVEELRKIGRLAGIDNDQLEACLQDGDRARTLVAWYQENAERDGVQATPSFIVNGKAVENQSYDAFKKLIEDELGS